jgi:2-methylcitrate dehydratase PrpD
MNITLDLADFIFSLQNKKLSEEICEKTKIHLLDTLGVALSAAKSEPINLILKINTGS